MAPKRGESNQGLIITLVFFILSTIGLGVATYYGFAEQDGLRKAAKDAQNKEKLATESRDWYKFQAALYRTYNGLGKSGGSAEVLAGLRPQFDQNSLGKSETDKDEATNYIKTDLEGRLGWNAAKNLPNKTWKELLDEEKNRNNELAKAAEDARNAQAQAEAASKAAAAKLAAAKTDFENKLTELRANSDKTLGAQIAGIKARQDEYAALSKKLEDANKAASDDKTKGLQAIAKLETQVKESQNKLRKLNQQFEELANRGIVIDAPPDMRLDWRVVRIDRTGQLVYINVGSADNLKPQVSFSVHGVGPDGRAIPAAKGSIDVLKIIGDHLAKARVNSVKDATGDPILKNDVLYSPTWSPTLRKHVALAGIMDLTGSGRDGLAELMRNLEKQNVIVDAYLDPTTQAVKGKISLQTDYLILGDGLEYTPEGKDRESAITRKRADQMKALQAEAVRNGVRVLSLSKYLEQIGYPLPKGGDGSPQTPPGSLTTTPAEPKTGKAAEEQPKEDKPGDAMEEKPK